MLDIQAINLDSVNTVIQAIQTLKIADNQAAFDADANHAFINELKDTYLCFDLEDFDTYHDWHAASDDQKTFKLVFEGAIKTFLGVDSSAFQIYGTQTPVDNNANGFDVYSVSMVFKHCGDTLVVKNQITLIRDIDGWEVEKEGETVCLLNEKTLNLDHIITVEFERLAKDLISDKSYQEMPNADSIAAAKSIVSKNEKLISLLSTITI